MNKEGKNLAQLFERGENYFRQGAYSEAIKFFDKIIKLAPKVDLTYLAKGSALIELGKHKQAIINFKKALEINETSYQALNNLGNAYADIKNFQEALSYFDRAIELQPQYAESYNGRGSVLLDLDASNDALTNFEKALSLAPQHADALNGFGAALAKLNRTQEAIESIQRAISLNPCNSKYHNNLGHILCRVNSYSEAIGHFDIAIQYNRCSAEYFYNRAAALFGLKKYLEAINDYESCLTLDPNYPKALGEAQRTRMLLNDWSNYETTILRIKNKLSKNEIIIQPFIVLSLLDNIDAQKKAALLFDEEISKKFNKKNIHKIERKKSRIRVGYFSSDFRNHPVCHLFFQTIERHQRETFEIFAFSFIDVPEDPWNIKIRDSVEHYINVSDKTDDEIVKIARSLELDIAVDMNGHTDGRKIGVFLSRVAAIQVNYLGYPGTSAYATMDYIIADQVIIPRDEKDFYSEKVVYLPDTYQPNSSQREVSRPLSREDVGLPPEKMIYCCFNQNNKITPIVFDTWMKILTSVNNSVLWLWVDDEIARLNLKKEAIARGIEGSRLLFAERMPIEAHLSRLRLADLFLDTFPYNAHTSASDALRMGLPVLTCQGSSFVSRVASSLLNAAGIPELITSNHSDYELLAVHLGTHPEELKSIKEKLNKNILTCALFDSVKYTKNLEKAYFNMFEKYHIGLPADHIVIENDA